MSAFVPTDPGIAGTPGGWQQLQWNFLAEIGVNAPDAWAASERPSGAPAARA